MTFELVKKTKKKVKLTMLGTVPLSGGDALLTVKPRSVLKKSLTIHYSGDTNYMASTDYPAGADEPVAEEPRKTDGHVAQTHRRSYSRER